MKYAKELQESIQRLPPSLQNSCMNYKFWKKRCNQRCNQQCNPTQALPGEMVVLLQSECNRVEAVFNQYYNKYTSPPSYFHRCYCWIRDLVSNHHKNTDNDANMDMEIDPVTVLLYAKLNSKTLYKICKRLQKIYSDPTPMQWLISIRTSHVYEFLGGHHTTHLALLYTTRFPMECPICLESTRKGHILIFRCGHHACISCTLQYVGLKSLHGEWYHLLAQAKRRECPYCRYDRAFSQVSTANI